VEGFPFRARFAALVMLRLFSAFVSIADTTMMAFSRLRLGRLVREGSRTARLTKSLPDRSDRPLAPRVTAAA